MSTFGDIVVRQTDKLVAREGVRSISDNEISRRTAQYTENHKPISMSNMGRWRRGEAVPKNTTLRVLARVLADPDDRFGEKLLDEMLESVGLRPRSERTEHTPRRTQRSRLIEVWPDLEYFSEAELNHLTKFVTSIARERSGRDRADGRVRYSADRDRRDDSDN